MEAALLDPHAIVFFATDGIVSTRPLIGLARVKKAGDAVDWATGNTARRTAASSSCRASTHTAKSPTDETGARTIKPVTKIRGGDAKKYAAKVKANQWLIENVLAAWRKPFDPQKPDTFPRIVAALSEVHHSRKRAGLARIVGSWRGGGRREPGEPGAGTREINVHSVGNKRELIPDESCWPDYVSVPGREARRCHRAHPNASRA